MDYSFSFSVDNMEMEMTDVARKLDEELGATFETYIFNMDLSMGSYSYSYSFSYSYSYSFSWNYADDWITDDRMSADDDVTYSLSFEYAMKLTSGCGAGKYKAGSGSIDCFGLCSSFKDSPAIVSDASCKSCAGIVSSDGFTCTKTANPPTMMPTTTDTVTMTVTVTLTTTASTISAKDTDTLQDTVADTIGVASESIHDFTVVIEKARRRLLADTYIWTISFYVQTSLSATSYSSNAAFAAGISSSITNNLAANIQSDLGLAVTVTGVTVVASTRSPSAAPTPTAQDDKRKIPVALVLGALIGIIVGGCLFCAGCIFAIYYMVIKKSKGPNDKAENELELHNSNISGNEDTNSSGMIKKDESKLFNCFCCKNNQVDKTKLPGGSSDKKNQEDTTKLLTSKKDQSQVSYCFCCKTETKEKQEVKSNPVDSLNGNENKDTHISSDDKETKKNLNGNENNDTRSSSDKTQTGTTF